MRAWLRWCLLLFVLLALVTDVVDAKKKTKRKHKSRAVEDDFVVSDDDDYDYDQDQTRLKKFMDEAHQPTSFDPADLESGKPFDPTSLLEGQDAGPQLMFVKLKDTDPPRSDDDVEYLAGQWKELLRAGLVEVEVYPIGHDTILFQVKSGKYWTKDVREFALQQPETAHFEWKSQKWYPEEHDEL